MSGSGVTEHALKFGAGGRLFGILTEPPLADSRTGQPVLVFLNAGLIHRVGPYRIHVSLARALAARGYRSLRIDLSGKGDSAQCASSDAEAALAADLQDIADGIDARFGPRRMVLFGLCSGADDAIRVVPLAPRFVGLCLIDAYCPPSARSTGPDDADNGATEDQLALRDLPLIDQTRSAFAAVIERGGRALSVFTGYAISYYDKVGRLEEAVGLPGYASRCTEIFWPDADHTFTLEAHRRRLVDSVLAWVDERPFPSVRSEPTVRCRDRG